MFNLASADIYNVKYRVKNAQNFSLVLTYFFEILNQYYFATSRTVYLSPVYLVLYYRYWY
jgi:hypothetical protein